VRNSITVHYLDQAIGVVDLSFGKDPGDELRVLASVSYPVPRTVDRIGNRDEAWRYTYVDMHVDEIACIPSEPSRRRCRLFLLPARKGG
jgi:hypothetical protein